MKYNLSLNAKLYRHALLFGLLAPFFGISQTEFTTWGNITGIRINNQLMEFKSSLVLIDKANEERITRKEGQ